MSGEKILIVEDDLDQTIGLTVRLKANGYQVFCAADGTTAFTQASKLQPDVIILDIGLPAGDGFKVLQWLAGIVATAVIPVIVLSGRDPVLARPQALHLGAKAFLQKPVDNDALLAAIRDVLSSATTLKKVVASPEGTSQPEQKAIRATFMGERIERWRGELRAAPGDTNLMNDLARVLATTSDPQLRNVEEAMQLVKKALSLMGAPTPAILDTLGIVNAAAGNFPEALDAARKAYKMAKRFGQTTLAMDLQERIIKYENSTPVTDEDQHP